MRCIVDCREDSRLANNFLELDLWGKPCYAHVIEAVRDAGCFSEIEIMTDSVKISDYCNGHYPDFRITPSAIHMGGSIFTISGRAPCITPLTIKQAVEWFNGTKLISARNRASFDFDGESISFYKNKSRQIFNAFCAWGGGGGGK